MLLNCLNLWNWILIFVIYFFKCEIKFSWFPKYYLCTPKILKSDTSPTRRYERYFPRCATNSISQLDESGNYFPQLGESRLRVAHATFPPFFVTWLTRPYLSNMHTVGVESSIISLLSPYSAIQSFVYNRSTDQRHPLMISRLPSVIFDTSPIQIFSEFIVCFFTEQKVILDVGVNF